MESALLSMASEFSGLPMDSLIGGPLNAAAKANAAMALTQTKFMLDTCFTKVTVKDTPEVIAKPGVYDDKGNEKEPPIFGSPAIAAHDAYVPIMITMSLTRGVLTPGTADYINDKGDLVRGTPPSIKNFTTAFNLPMLTIVPLNSLAVSTVDIAFEMEVKSSFDESESQKSEKATHAEASFEASCGWGPFSVTITGKASYDQKDSSTHDTHYQKSNSAKYTVGVHAAQLPLPSGVNIIIDAFAKTITPIELKAADAKQIGEKK